MVREATWEGSFEQGLLGAGAPACGYQKGKQVPGACLMGSRSDQPGLAETEQEEG